MPIFDQGYQHWKGHLSGYGWRWLAIARHGIRIGLKSMLMRMLLLAAIGPALALAGVISLWGLVEQRNPWAVAFLGGTFLAPLLNDPAAYRVAAWTLCFHFFIKVEMFFVMILVLLVGPNLISQDLRFNAFPLYFSRPVRRIDYFFGKLGVIAFFLALVAVAPAVLAWILGLFFSLSFYAIVDTFSLLLSVVIFGVVVAGSAGLFMLALSSLSRNSRYVAAFWGGMWFLTWTVSLMFEGMYQSSLYRQRAMLNHQLFRKQDELRQLKSGQRGVDPQFQNPPFQNQPVGPQGQPPGPKPFEDPAKRGDAPPPQPVPVDVKALQKELEEQHKKWLEQERLRREQDKQRIEKLTGELEALKADYKKYHEETGELLREDWRPLISYTANLERLGFALIGSQRAFEKVDELRAGLQPKNMNVDFDNSMRQEPLATMMVPQYPWYWSALVLLALGGLSIWILHKRVTTLDRLK